MLGRLEHEVNDVARPAIQRVNRALNGTCHRCWSDDGQPGSNPQVLINALTGEVGPSTVSELY